MTYGLIAAAAGAGKTHTVAAYASARTRLTGKRVSELGAAELSEVMRFGQQWERDASLRLRDGDKGVTAACDRRGRIRGDHREAAYARAAGAWLADHLHGKDALLLTGNCASPAL